jgi:hypothetical protein
MPGVSENEMSGAGPPSAANDTDQLPPLQMPMMVRIRPVLRRGQLGSDQPPSSGQLTERSQLERRTLVGHGDRPARPRAAVGLVRLAAHVPRDLVRGL